jgi:hypothetical protein
MSEQVTWDDLGPFAKDALTYASQTGYIFALDDDEDEEGYDYEGWSERVIWKLREQGLLIEHDFKAGLYRITHAGRALVASQSAGESAPARKAPPEPAEPELPVGVTFNQHVAFGAFNVIEYYRGQEKLFGIRQYINRGTWAIVKDTNVVDMETDLLVAILEHARWRAEQGK